MTKRPSHTDRSSLLSQLDLADVSLVSECGASYEHDTAGEGEAAWSAVVQRRAAELGRGDVATVDGDEVREALRRSLSLG